MTNKEVNDELWDRPCPKCGSTDNDVLQSMTGVDRVYGTWERDGDEWVLLHIDSKPLDYEVHSTMFRCWACGYDEDVTVEY